MTVVIEERGLTTAEIVVAIGVLGLMLATVILLFTQLMANTTKNNLLNMGTLYADRILEQAVSAARGRDPAFEPLTVGEESMVSQGDDRVTHFAYRLEATRMTPFEEPGESWFLEVEVQWWHDSPDDPSETRAGYGKLSTQQRRMVYIKPE